MLSPSYLIYLTKTFGSINKIFGRVKKTNQAKTLVDLSKRVWLTGQKFGRLNQNVLWNQPNIVNQTILLDDPFFFLRVRTVLYSVYCCAVNCVLLAVRSVEVGCTNSIAAASIEPWLAQLQTTFQLDEKYCTAKWVKYLGRKIVRKSFLYIPCAEGSLFYLIYKIIINNKSRFVLLTEQLNECYFIAHTQAFKIFDVTNFEYKKSFFDNRASSIIT